MQLKDVQRFWDKVEFSSSCWPWKGALFSGTRRGQFKINKKTVKSYRFAYEIIKGDIPTGLTIDHLCKNPNCVNPWHLEAVTAQENTKRVPRAKECKRGHPRIPGSRRCAKCGCGNQRPSRTPEARRLARLRRKEAQDATQPA